MAETLQSFDTAQGKFDLVKYENGAEHIYQVDEEGRKHHLSSEKIIDVHHSEEEPAEGSRIAVVRKRVGDAARRSVEAARQAGVLPLTEEQEAARRKRIDEVFNSRGDEAGETKEHAALKEEYPRKGKWQGQTVTVLEDYPPNGEGEVYVRTEEIDHGIKKDEVEFVDNNEKHATAEKTSGRAVFTTRKGDKINMNIVGPSKKYPDGKNPASGKLYLEGVAEDGNRFEHVSAERVEFLDERDVATEIKKPAEAKNKELSFKERSAHPETILRLQEAYDKKFKQAMREQTILDLNDPSMKEKVAEQIRSQVVDEYLQDLPEQDKADRENLKSNLINAMGQDPDFLEAQRKLMGSPASAEKESQSKDVRIKSIDHNGNKYVIEVRTDGTPVRINRNVNKNWEVVSETGWFDYNGLEMDILNPPGEPGEEANGRAGTPNQRHEITPDPEDDGIDVEAMEATMARIEQLQNELAALATEPERMAEAAALHRELADEMAKLRRIWNAAPTETIGGEETEVTQVISPEEAQEAVNKRKQNIFQKMRDKLRRRKEEPVPVPVAGAAVVERDRKSEKDRRTLAGVVVGGLLVGGTALVTWYLTKQGHHPDIINNFCDGGRHAWENRPGGGGGGGHGHSLVEGLPKGIHYEELKVHSGNWHDTIWTHVQGKTSAGGDVHQNVQQVLNMNSKAIMQHAQPGENLWEAAHHLPEHFKFKVPNHF
jgi:hypothetical protein